MSFFEAIILGIIQGVTEFLPVSSSGHLIVAEKIFHAEARSDLLFEAVLHLGTLLAVIAAFWSDWKIMYNECTRLPSDLVKNMKACIHNKIYETDEVPYIKILHNPQRKMFVMMIVSTIFTAAVGYLFKNIAGKVSHSVLAAGLGFLITSVFLFVVDYWNYGDRLPKDSNFRQAAVIGLLQGISVFPGISRSGITITAGRFFGFRKNYAIRYSYLMSVPVILGAVLLELGNLKIAGITWKMGLIYLCGMLSASVTGYFCIRILIRQLQKQRFRIFAIYCALIGIVSLVCNFMLPIS